MDTDLALYILLFSFSGYGGLMCDLRYRLDRRCAGRIESTLCVGSGLVGCFLFP